MITYKDGDIFEDDADVLVNPVNCVGVMGKGLALEFKHRFPSMYDEYRKACDQKKMFPGGVLGVVDGGHTVVCLATKKHWRNPSEILWIILGLAKLKGMMKDYALDSVAIPMLGCGCGGLDWPDVRRAIESVFDVSHDLDVRVYGPPPEAE